MLDSNTIGRLVAAGLWGAVLAQKIAKHKTLPELAKSILRPREFFGSIEWFVPLRVSLLFVSSYGNYLLANKIAISVIANMFSMQSSHVENDKHPRMINLVKVSTLIVNLITALALSKMIPRMVRIPFSPSLTVAMLSVTTLTMTLTKVGRFY